MKNFAFFFLFMAVHASAQPDYTAYNTLLNTYVSSSGKVNYKGLKANKQTLTAITSHFSEQQPSDSWSRNERLAFWINAYNAFTLQLIVDNYPVKSITALDGGKPWDVKRVLIGGKRYSLNEIENEIIRPKFNDARIHFALNCAAKSCPPLLNQAFLPKTLNTQLEQRTRSFIQSKNNNLTPQAVQISKIFEWYGSDFGDLTAFLNRYSGKITIASNANITFAEYDWSLNE